MCRSSECIPSHKPFSITLAVYFPLGSLGSPLYTCLISHSARDVWRAFLHASMTLSVILSPFYISGYSITFPNGNCNFRGTKVWVFFIYFLPSSSLLADRAATFYHDHQWAHPLWQQSCWFSSQSYHSQKRFSLIKLGGMGAVPGKKTTDSCSTSSVLAVFQN